jgi:hypothetical protein
VVGGVDHLLPCGRPDSAVLLCLLGRQGLRRAAFNGRGPDVYVAAALAAKEDLLTVGRDQGIAKSPAVAVVKKVRILNHDLLVFAVQRNPEDVMVLPLVIQLDVQDVPAVGSKYRIHRVEWTVG